MQLTFLGKTATVRSFQQQKTRILRVSASLLRYCISRLNGTEMQVDTDSLSSMNKQNSENSMDLKTTPKMKSSKFANVL